MNTKAHILIVDDSPININLLGSILEKNYRISVAISGQEALDFIEQQVPDLILLDIMMPVMDGYQFMQCMNTNPDTANIPVIVISAKNDEQTELDGLALGAVDFIAKPISPGIVKMRVKNHLLLIQQKTQIEYSEMVLKAVVATISDGLIVYSHDGVITEMNPQLMRLWPRIKKSCKTLTIDQLFEQSLLPDIDHQYGDFLTLYNLFSTKNAVWMHGTIRLHKGRYYHYFTAPLIHKKNTLGFLLCFNDITKETLLKQDLTKIAITDELTGLYNRRYFNDIIKRELSVTQRYQSILGILILDIDFFKKINDQWGHGSGDRVLELVAKEILSHSREVDFCFRYGGEEFVVLLPNTTDEGIIDAGRRLMAGISEIRFGQIQVTISIGGTSSEYLQSYSAETSADDLIDLADRELYRAKNNGRNRMFMINHSNPYHVNVKSSQEGSDD